MSNDCNLNNNDNKNNDNEIIRMIRIFSAVEFRGCVVHLYDTPPIIYTGIPIQ